MHSLNPFSPEIVDALNEARLPKADAPWEAHAKVQDIGHHEKMMDYHMDKQQSHEQKVVDHQDKADTHFRDLDFKAESGKLTPEAMKKHIDKIAFHMTNVNHHQQRADHHDVMGSKHWDAADKLHSKAHPDKSYSGDSTRKHK